MKILFVEDELSKNIPRIIRLFSKYLGKKRIQKLQELESDEYGAEPEEIKEIVEETNLIDLEYRFPDALRKLIHHENYALFIIDRNLVESDYEFNGLNTIDSNYTESQYEKYFEREGDYFLYKLACQGVDVKNKFYYLTAYSASEEIRGKEDIQTLIEHYGNFKTENFIEKGSNADFDRFKNIVENIPILNLQNENREYLDILKIHIGDKAAEKFIHLLAKKDSDKPEEITENLGSIRNIFDNILNVIAKKCNAPDWCRNKNNPDQIIMRAIISWINHYDKIDRKVNYQYDSNSLIKNFMYDIQEIASDFGPHDDLTPKPSGYQPTSDTVNALIYAFKDIILWFGKICNP